MCRSTRCVHARPRAPTQCGARARERPHVVNVAPSNDEVPHLDRQTDQHKDLRALLCRLEPTMAMSAPAPHPLVLSFFSSFFSFSAPVARWRRDVAVCALALSLAAVVPVVLPRKCWCVSLLELRSVFFCHEDIAVAHPFSVHWGSVPRGAVQADQLNFIKLILFIFLSTGICLSSPFARHCGVFFLLNGAAMDPTA